MLNFTGNRETIGRELSLAPRHILSPISMCPDTLPSVCYCGWTMFLSEPVCLWTRLHCASPIRTLFQQLSPSFLGLIDFLSLLDNFSQHTNMSLFLPYVYKYVNIYLYIYILTFFSCLPTNLPILTKLIPFLPFTLESTPIRFCLRQPTRTAFHMANSGIHVTASSGYSSSPS